MRAATAPFHANGAALGRERLSLSRSAVQYCCFVAILFASADAWPTIRIGFTFRLSQLFMFLCVPLLAPSFRTQSVDNFPGSMWCLLWILWTTVSLPFSLMLSRSVGYAFWLVSDLLIVFVFVQAFRTPADADKLVSWLLLSFTILSIFGVVQLVAGVLGVSILVSEWWVKGVLPRVNGISYEPSYYATYLLPGWVFSNYLLGRSLVRISSTLILLTALLTTVALFVSSSRLGWGLMLLWIAFRAGVSFIRFLLGKKAPLKTVRRNILLVCLLPMFIGVLVSVQTARVTAVLQTMSAALSGLGVFGQASHSSDYRADRTLMTWGAFLAHPIVGTGLGAVPVEIANQQGVPIISLEDAKENEGMSVVIEMLASIGLVGFVLVIGFLASLAYRYRGVYASGDSDRRLILRGLSWALFWLTLALQFNQNFLRIYVWVDIGVLTTVISAYARHPVISGGRAAPFLAFGSRDPA